MVRLEIPVDVTNEDAGGEHFIHPVLHANTILVPSDNAIEKAAIKLADQLIKELKAEKPPGESLVAMRFTQDRYSLEGIRPTATLSIYIRTTYPYDERNDVD